MDRKNVVRAALVVTGALGILAAWFGAPVFPFGLCGYLVLSLVPGAAVYRLASKDPDLLEEATAAVALSPVLTTALATGAMLAGIPTRETATLVLILTCILGLFAFRGFPAVRRSLDRRQILALAVLLVGVSVATSYLPLTEEWWRLRSDAWFHGAVIAQITDFGIPPEDPYAAGFPLQYMWFYHVYALTLSKASGIEPFTVMALINIPALIGFALAAFLFSSIFRKAFSHNFAATLTALFGMNAAFWLFIPLKLARAFVGEVRWGEEVSRVFALKPFNILSARGFVQLGFVQEFLLDKFMVATAFSVALCLMGVLWWAAAKYVASEKREYLVVSFLSAFGLVAFHTALGTAAFGGVAGGLVLLIVLRRYMQGYTIRPVVTLLVAMMICGILLLPYLYSVAHAKTGDEAFPIGFSGLKLLGILISCALVIFLAAFQFRRIVRSRDPATCFLLCTTAVIVGICAVLKLPAANAYDKFPFLVFFPLAVVGGWTVAEFSERSPSPRTRRLRYILVSLAAFGPLNIFMLAGYYNTTPGRMMDRYEEKVGAWIHAATPRESIMIDTNLNCFLLVAGPRRYYFASEFYAESWGYDRAEIAKRKQIKSDLYSPGPLEPLTLETLGTMPQPVYVIVRKDDDTVDAAKFDQHPSLFRRVFASGPITVFEMDRGACLKAAREPAGKS
jgi:hypothetical protein